MTSLILSVSSYVNIWPLRYPRGRAIGGSALHNAVINLVINTRAEFAGLQSMFGDSWSLDSIWDYFKLIEKNEYIPLSPDHGYGGWMVTNTVSVPIILNPQFLGVLRISLLQSTLTPRFVQTCSCQSSLDRSFSLVL